MKGRLKLIMNPTPRVLRDKGLDGGGAVQRFHTANVMRRMEKYMPKVSGMTIKSMINQTDTSKPYIIIDTPYAKYLYYGKVMVGKAPKKVTDRSLAYNTAKNALAGPLWDRRLATAEGRTIQAELQQFINRR